MTRGTCSAARGCRLLWTVDIDADMIEVDHITPTTSGSAVCVTRRFPGALVRRADRWGWTDEQDSAVAVWVARLHDLSLEAIP